MLLTINGCAFLLDVTCKHVVVFLISAGVLEHEEGAQGCGLDCKLTCSSWLSSIVFPPAPTLLILAMPSSAVRRNLMLVSLSLNTTDLVIQRPIDN